MANINYENFPDSFKNSCTASKNYLVLLHFSTSLIEYRLREIKKITTKHDIFYHRHIEICKIMRENVRARELIFFICNSRPAFCKMHCSQGVYTNKYGKRKLEVIVSKSCNIFMCGLSLYLIVINESIMLSWTNVLL